MTSATPRLPNLQAKVRFYFEDIETPMGKLINFAITGLVLLSSAIFVAETYPLSPEVRAALGWLDTLILLIFTLEYGLRFWSAEHKLRFIFNLYSLIDLVAILPFLFTALDIRFIRIFRWFRILRLIRFFEGRTIIGYVSREDSAIFARILFTIFTIIFVYSGLIYQVEHPSNPEAFATFLDAVYFSVATMTTVGFGDITPASQVGRLLTVLMILTGIALIPWQLGDLIKQLVKTSNQVETLCLNCGQDTHDIDARFCKICGHQLARVGDTCQIPSATPEKR
ncbi:MAG: ion transporter [Synechococcales cyanobacterium M58_A2018_015]|nr:ion transporter [Synechococcales cyanobacterium M58_A2018_015]